MLKFLKEFDPFRLLFIAIVAIVARFYWLADDVYLIPALRWLSIGEMMEDGNTLYKDIWTTLKPFSAGTYYLINAVFGKSMLALRILSLMLCLTQAFLFNFYVQKTHIYDQKTSYPAFFYMLYASINYDFYTLSPIQLGITFLLPVMYILFKDVRVGEKPNNHFLAGFFIGIASLFYLPFASFVLFTLYSFAVFSSFDVKRVFQLLFAFIFPWAMVFTYYYLNGALFEMIENLIEGNLIADRILYADPFSIMKVALPSVIIALISFMLVSSKRNFLNYQYSSMKIMVIWFLNGLLCFLLMDEWSYFNIYILVPVFTFFTVYLFIQIQRTLIKESLFWIITIVFIALHVHNVSLDKARAYSGKSSILISKEKEVRFNGTPITDKTVLLMGTYPEALIHNKQSTVYADWNLALRHFKDLNNYENISNIYSNVYEHQPDYIFDRAGIMPHLMERIPGLKDSYEASYDQKVFKRKGQ